MQKNYKIQVKSHLHIRSNPVRLMAVFLALVTAFGMTELGRHGADQRRAEAVNPSMSFSNPLLEKENETTRMPVRFDDGLRAPTISGL